MSYLISQTLQLSSSPIIRRLPGGNSSWETMDLGNEPRLILSRSLSQKLALLLGRTPAIFDIGKGNKGNLLANVLCYCTASIRESNVLLILLYDLIRGQTRYSSAIINALIISSQYYWPIAVLSTNFEHGVHLFHYIILSKEEKDKKYLHPCIV